MASVFLVMRKRECIDVFWNEREAGDKLEQEVMREVWDTGVHSKALINSFLGQIRKKYSVEEFLPKGTPREGISSVRSS